MVIDPLNLEQAFVPVSMRAGISLQIRSPSDRGHYKDSASAECDHYMNRRKILYSPQYEEPTRRAVLTKGYNLPVEYVIHTVGPIVSGVLNGGHRQDLHNCYENVLKYCVENAIRSVAFCCISTGEFHFPGAKAAKIAVEAVTDFLKENENQILTGSFIMYLRIWTGNCTKKSWLGKC